MPVSPWTGESTIGLVVNGTEVSITVPVRESLADALRDRLRLTGTHLGCEQGVCGSCTVLMDGGTVRSCTTLAVQAEGCVVWTVEGLSPPQGLSRLQQLLSDEHGLQCGFCTPGIVVAATELLVAAGGPLAADVVRAALSGNLCRCTGYDGIVRAVVAASQDLADVPAALQISKAGRDTGIVSALPPPASAYSDCPRVAPATTKALGNLWPDVRTAVAGFAVGALLRRFLRG